MAAARRPNARSCKIWWARMSGWLAPPSRTARARNSVAAVSYTHLTLPTKRIV